MKLLVIFFSVKWKNPVARKDEAYKPTQIEHVANIITHGVTVCKMKSFETYSLKFMILVAFEKFFLLKYFFSVSLVEVVTHLKT